MYILGLSFFYHDSAACLTKDGEVVAAAQEERFSRVKHDADFPRQSIQFCLDKAGIKIEDVKCIAYYEKPYTKFERIIFSHFLSWPWVAKIFHDTLNSWLEKKLRIPSVIRKELNYTNEIIYCRHHDSHAASSFFTSPFDDAAILTIDGVGEWTTTAIAHGKKNTITRKKELQFPHSLGLVYSAFTNYLGFAVNDGEYKVMGLAPYGQPTMIDKIHQMVDLKPDGSLTINKKYFSYESGMAMCNEVIWENHFGFLPRRKSDPIKDHHKDMAASIQLFLEKSIILMCQNARKEINSENLCLSGGVALNCVANSTILNNNIFKNIYVFPAAGDAGGAVGAALFAWHQVYQNPRLPKKLVHVNWGPNYTSEQIKQILTSAHIPYREYDEEKLIEIVARQIEEQNVIGWFQGCMEFGPRALGNRSILADPRKIENWQRVNLKIKFRESFRPFAPALLSEQLSEFFDFKDESPFMLFTAKSKTDKIPAVVHVDKSARIQTVNKQQNPRFYSLIEKFGEYTGVPVLINTSFNTSDMPIVCSPQNAIQCFLQSNIDTLVMENIVINRRDIPWATNW